MKEPAIKNGTAPEPLVRREPSTDTAVNRISRLGREIPILASLRTRLLMLVLAGIVPFLGLVLYNAIDQRYYAGLRAHQEALQVARMAGARQDQLVESARQLLTTLALLREVQNLDKEACERIFAGLIKTHTGYVNIGVIRPDGRAFATGLPMSGEVDASDRLYFQLAMESRQFAVGEFVVGRVSEKPSLNVAYPAIDRSGQVRAVVYAALDVNWLKRMLISSTLPPGSSVTLLDRDNLTIVRYPDPEGKITGTYITGPPRPTNAISGAARMEAPARRLWTVQTNEFGRETTSIMRGRDGVERLYASTRLGHTGVANEIKITVGIPVTQTFGPANRALIRNLLFGFGVAAAALAITWYFGNLFVLRRIRALLRSTERIGMGDYSVRVGDSKGQGELYVLSRAFDDMAGTLQRRVEERDKAEARLRSLNADLEQRVARRTAQLKRSNEDLEQFAYVASHDLQEPLRMVGRYVELLRDRYQGQFDDKGREFIAFALDGAKRMEELIQALLTYSRVDTQGQPFERTDCNAVLDRALLNLKAALEESHAVVTVDPLPKLMADEVQLGQLFQNLLSNAIKFHAEKPPEIRVQAKQEGDHWHFAIRDNGIGIPEEGFQRVFVIFQRLQGRTKYPGTGIGLSLCKKIVERHTGRIWVESKVGEGTTFHFTLAAEPRPAPHDTSLAA